MGSGLHPVLVVAHRLFDGVGSFSYGTWDLVPWPGIGLGPSALAVQSLNHWTIWKVPWFDFFFFLLSVLLITTWLITSFLLLLLAVKFALHFQVSQDGNLDYCYEVFFSNIGISKLKKFPLMHWCSYTIQNFKYCISFSFSIKHNFSCDFFEL